MRSDPPATPPGHAAPSRSDRLKAALRANLQRRKQQQRAREADDAAQPPEGHEDAAKPAQGSG